MAIPPAAPQPRAAVVVADESAKPATQPASRALCAAKCGFFASDGGEYCSKCAVKRETEWASWHGALSKKSECEAKKSKRSRKR